LSLLCLDSIQIASKQYLLRYFKSWV